MNLPTRYGMHSVFSMWRAPKKISRLGSGADKAKPAYSVFLWLLSGAMVLHFIVKPDEDITKEDTLTQQTRYEMLKRGFENNYVKPYVRFKELPEDYYCPCYKYQGKWKLKTSTKYRSLGNGFHYAAKEVMMHARYMDERDDRGKSFEGNEYQKHEI